MHQGVYYEQTSYYDDLAKALLRLHFHMMNVEPGTKNCKLNFFVASYYMKFPSNKKMLGHESTLFLDSFVEPIEPEPNQH